MFRYNAGVDDVEGKPKKIKPRSFPAETPRAPATAPSRRGLQKDSKEQVAMSHTLTLTHTHISYPYLIRANLKASICLIPIPARSRPGGSVSHPNSAGGQGADGEG